MSFTNRSGDTYKHVITIIEHTRAITKKGVKEFMKSGEIPENWTNENDFALSMSSVQFGYKQFRVQKTGIIATHIPEILRHSN